MNIINVDYITLELCGEVLAYNKIFQNQNACVTEVQYSTIKKHVPN